MTTPTVEQLHESADLIANLKEEDVKDLVDIIVQFIEESEFDNLPAHDKRAMLYGVLVGLAAAAHFNGERSQHG